MKEAHSFAIVHEDAGSADVLTVSGRLDVTTSPRLAGRLSELVWRGRGSVLVDLSGVPFMDSSGLSVLLNALRRLTRQQRRLGVVCGAGAVLLIFELARLADAFELFETRDAALYGLSMAAQERQDGPSRYPAAPG